MLRSIRQAALMALFGSLLALPPTPAIADGGWRWPVEGPVLTPYRNGDDPYAAGQHRGIDIGAPVGTAVMAAVAGTVVFAGSVPSAGRTVTVRTLDGSLDTTYLHLDSLSVERGRRLDAGDPIGRSGTSGNPSTPEPHVHFGVRLAGSDHDYRDPLGYLPGPARPPHPTPVAVRVPKRHPRPEPVRPLTRRHPLPNPAPLPSTSPLRGRAPAPRPSPVPVRAPAPQGITRPGIAPAPLTASAPRVALARDADGVSVAGRGSTEAGLVAASGATGLGLLLALGAVLQAARRRVASSIAGRWPSTSRLRSIT